MMMDLTKAPYREDIFDKLNNIQQQLNLATPGSFNENQPSVDMAHEYLYHRP